MMIRIADSHFGAQYKCRHSAQDGSGSMFVFWNQYCTCPGLCVLSWYTSLFTNTHQYVADGRNDGRNDTGNSPARTMGYVFIEHVSWVFALPPICLCTLEITAFISGYITETGGSVSALLLKYMTEDRSGSIWNQKTMREEETSPTFALEKHSFSIQSNEFYNFSNLWNKT